MKEFLLAAKQFIAAHLVAVVGGVSVVTIGAVAAVVVATSSVNIEQTVNEVTIEAGTELTIVASDYFDVDEETAKKAVVDTSKVDTTKVGEYEAIVTFGKNNYSIKVIVVDTTAPNVSLDYYILYTNSLDAIGIAEYGAVSDYSACTSAVSRFEKVKDAGALTDADLTTLVNDMLGASDPSTFESRETAVPSEDGVYSAILTVTDAFGNKTEKEVLVVYDTTAPEVSLSETTNSITVKANDIETKPDLSLDKVSAVDNFDGELTVSEDNVSVADKGTNGDTHTWEVVVSVKDKAGNEDTLTYTIVVEKKTTQTANNDNPTNPSQSTSPSNPSGTTDDNIVTINGFTLDLTDKSERGREWTKSLASAGYYNPVWSESNSRYYMLIKGSDDTWEYDEWLCNYVTERGGTPGTGYSNNWGECTNADVVLMSIEVR